MGTSTSRYVRKKKLTERQQETRAELERKIANKIKKLEEESLYSKKR